MKRKGKETQSTRQPRAHKRTHTRTHPPTNCHEEATAEGAIDAGPGAPTKRPNEENATLDMETSACGAKRTPPAIAARTATVEARRLILDKRRGG